MSGPVAMHATVGGDAEGEALVRSGTSGWFALALATTCLACSGNDAGASSGNEECGQGGAQCDAAAGGGRTTSDGEPHDAGNAGAGGNSTSGAGSSGGVAGNGAKDGGTVAGSGGTGGDTPVADAGSDCTPDCDGRDCGDDPACGTSCGTCAAELVCTDGACVDPGPPRDNGETCTRPTQCMSGQCSESESGDFFCYGNAGPNDPCTDTFDCAGGVCTYATTDTGPTLCVEAIPFCVDSGISDACIDAAVDFCRLYQRCGSSSIADYDDFDICVGLECQEDYTSAECLQFVDDVAMDLIPCP